MDSASDARRLDERAVTDALFDSLANGTRRRVLRYLDAVGGTTPLPQLVSALASEESSRSLDAEPRPRDDRIRLSLRHVHLPKLQAAGLIEWEDDCVALSATATALPLSRPLPRGLLYESFTDGRTRV
ncbi:hypothetical protein ACFR9U_03855 [Halorientalis brevis]|uniref:DUF7344 domain-containing protein n=1 Tax=Halorientalis brevis TaxID=1126241 RepID=A0ABD6C7T1_9EURY|nr:hypothetical protein [Halorientalis brevis]